MKYIVRYENSICNDIEDDIINTNNISKKIHIQ